VFSDKDNILIKNFYQMKRYKATELRNKFPNKWWTKSSTNMLLTKFSQQTTKCLHWGKCWPG